MVNVKNMVLGIGIVIVFALVLWQGIEAFYPSPQWDEYCEDSIRYAVPKPIDSTDENLGANDDYKECQMNYDVARDSHAQKVFFISLIVAIITIVIGHSILKIEPVGSALMASGIWAIFWGSVINWRNFSSILRFLLLLLVLIMLIYITIKLNKKK